MKTMLITMLKMPKHGDKQVAKLLLNFGIYDHVVDQEDLARAGHIGLRWELYWASSDVHLNTN